MADNLTTEKVFRKNYATFCNILKCEDGLLPYLVEKQIISYDDVDDIKSKTVAEKGPTLLRHISGPLEAGHTYGLKCLLDIMINHGKPDTQKFAIRIKRECLFDHNGRLNRNLYCYFSFRIVIKLNNHLFVNLLCCYIVLVRTFYHVSMS